MTRKSTPIKEPKTGATTRAKKQQHQDIVTTQSPVTTPAKQVQVGKRLFKRQAPAAALGATTPAQKKTKKSHTLNHKPPTIALNDSKVADEDVDAACMSPEANQQVVIIDAFPSEGGPEHLQSLHQPENFISEVTTPPPAKRLRTLIESPQQQELPTIVDKASVFNADEGVEVPVQRVEPASIDNLPLLVDKPAPSSPAKLNAQPSLSPALWTPMQRCVSEYATLKGQCVTQVWKDARSTALQTTLNHLIDALEAGPKDPPLPPGTTTLHQPPPLHVTAGVSYIMPTESHQVGPGSFDPLPHLAIRPPGLEDLPRTDVSVAAVLAVLQKAPTSAAIFPLREENKMKEYLLFPKSRLTLLEDCGGKIEQISGVAGLEALLQDRSFVCLHYQLVEESAANNTKKLEPCASPAASNVQLGIMVRRGVGGTSPMRAAARKESAGGPLSALLDDAPEAPQKTATTTTATSTGDGGHDTALEVDTAALPTHQKITFSTLSCRLELYVDEQVWKGLDRTTQCVLFSAVRHLEQEVAKQLDKHSWDRLLHCCSLLNSKLCSLHICHPQGDLQARVVGRDKIDSSLASIILPHITSEWMPDKDFVRLHILCSSTVPTSEETNIPEAKITVKLEVVQMTRKKENSSVITQTTQVRPQTSSQQQGNPPAVQGLPPGVVLVPVMLPGHARPVLVPMRVAQQPCASGGQQQQPPPKLPPSPAVQQAQSPLQSSSKSSKLHRPSALDLPTAVVLTAACLSAAGASGAGISMPWSYYTIGTRDSFSHLLVPVTSEVFSPTGRSYIKTEWFFKASEAPIDYETVLKKSASLPGGPGGSIQQQTTDGDDGDSSSSDVVVAAVLEGMVRSVEASQSDTAPNEVLSSLLPVGVTTYNEIFSQQQLSGIERCSDSMDVDARDGKLPSECFHTTRSKGGGLKRTKFFFGARYLWTREQLAGPDAHVAMGVRADVPNPPSWMKDLVEAPLVDSSLLPQGWIDSIALNMYHDGSEGIQSHYDDSQRFHQPIYSLRLFSDSRLSFGTQLYGYTNGAFCIPMPRGCVTVMEAGGYAANGVKHCVRPSDMAGKSAGMILRRINPFALEAARRYVVTECTEWMKCLSLNASLRPMPPIQGTSPGNQAQRALRLATSRQQRPASVTLQKQVSRVMDHMLDRVEGAVRREKSDATAAALMLAGMVRKVESAERIGLDLSSSDAAIVFSVLDDIVSFCERPVASMQQQQQQRNVRPLKRKRPVQSITQGLRAEMAGLLEQQEISRVLSGAVMAVDAHSQFQTDQEETKVSTAACPTYEGFASVLHLPAVGLLRLAQSVAAAVLLGDTLCASTNSTHSTNSTEVQAGMHMAVIGCNLHSTEDLRRALLVAIKWTQQGAAPSAPPSLSVAQFQMAVSFVYRALCVVSMHASGVAARQASVGGAVIS